jgi:CheY-like chemotaxis protein
VTEARQSFRVLLIDDAPAIYSVVEAALQDVCEVRTAYNGEIGTQIARHWLPDVIICDMLMPGLSGFDTILQMKALDELRSVPIILLSGVAEELESFPGLKEIVACIVPNPFEVSALRRAAAELLPGSGRINSADLANPPE